jgi:hypothetical protein
MLNVDSLVKPVKSIPTSVGRIFLYRLRDSDLDTFRKLAEGASLTRIRAFLPSIASRIEITRFRDERAPLEAAARDQLTNDDVEKLAEAYALVVARKAQPEGAAAPAERSAAEAATSYLDRVLKHELDIRSKEWKQLQGRLAASTGGIFDAVRESSSSLGSTLTAYERLTRTQIEPSLLTPNLDGLHEMNARFARQSQERAEELEMVRLTGQMTAESARTLKNLAEAATVLLERMDARDVKTDRSTRNQITIAVWSVGVSAVLALFALLVTGLSYMQDRRNIESGDQWQVEVLNTMQAEVAKQQATVDELTRVRKRLSELEAKLPPAAASQPNTTRLRRD